MPQGAGSEGESGRPIEARLCDHLAQIHPYFRAHWIGESFWLNYVKRVKHFEDPPWLERLIGSEILSDSFLIDLRSTEDSLTLTVNSIQWVDFAQCLRSQKRLRKRKFYFPIDVVFSGNVRWMLAKDDQAGFLLPSEPANIETLEWAYSIVKKRRRGYRVALSFYGSEKAWQPTTELAIHESRANSGFMPISRVGKELHDNVGYGDQPPYDRVSHIPQWYLIVDAKNVYQVGRQAAAWEEYFPKYRYLADAILQEIANRGNRNGSSYISADDCDLIVARNLTS